MLKEKFFNSYAFNSYTRKEIKEDNILKAFGMIERWRNSGKYCCININSDYNYCWRIEIFEHLSKRHEPVYIVDGEKDFYTAVLDMDKKLKYKPNKEDGHGVHNKKRPVSSTKNTRRRTANSPAKK